MSNAKAKDDQPRDATTNDQSSEDDRDLTLHPLSPEQALRGFLQVDPEKVKEAEKREKEEGKEGADPGNEKDDGA